MATKKTGTTATTTKRATKVKAEKIEATEMNLPFETTSTTTTLSAEERFQMIATAAYYRAEKRGFALGHQDEDWKQAEQEIAAQYC